MERLVVDGEGAAQPAAPAPLIVEEKPICQGALAEVVLSCGAFARPRFAKSLCDAARLLEQSQTPLTVVDLFTINYDFEALQRLAAAAASPVVAIDDRVNPTFAQRALQAGARGYWAKVYELDQFRAALIEVLGGGEHFPDGVSTQVIRGPRRGGAGLSARQLSVLKEMAVGKTNREIAEALDITPGTVKLHIHAIFKLTGARNRTEAALIAGRFLAPGAASRR